MSKKRELLERALNELDDFDPENMSLYKLMEEIRDYLANANPSEAEPLSEFKFYPEHRELLRYNPREDSLEIKVDVDRHPAGTKFYPSPRKEFVRLSDEEITEIIGPYSMGTVGGYTRKLFDTIQDVLEEKNR